jgi:hypothetical protein
MSQQIRKTKKRPAPIKGKRKRVTVNEQIKAEIVEVPSAGTQIVSRRPYPPKIVTTSISTHVRNTELVFGVSTAAVGAFVSTRIPLNANFPSWLAGIAANFSKYRWHFLKFIYIPIVPTTVTGQVVLSLGYDFIDNAPASISAAQQYFNSVTAPVWAGYNGANELNTYSKVKTPGSVCVVVDNTRLGGPSGDAFYRFANGGNFGGYSGQDKNIYCPGYLDVSTAGGLALGVGNLFIEYTVELIEPINPTANA